ncbi:MAG: ATP-binding protein [Lachnospiraceae bacterium]|nr:ATP-binding protein [Lachnospiraceae bacterium]
METKLRKLPVGIQDFEKIVTEDYIIVDKTEYIHRLVHTGNPCFLSRPRRFGKSLFLSTLKAYWEGRKELFNGLKIEELEKDNEQAWEPHPVLYMDFNRDDYNQNTALEGILDDHLTGWEKKYGVTSDGKLSLAVRFKGVIRAAFEQTGKRCVVLVDEYDKALLDTMDNKDLIEHNKAVFKGFFSNLKSEDAYIQFVFITGVTKFSKVSIFSDLNQLRDISMTADYAGICGITEDEMKGKFMPEIEALALEHDLTVQECLERLRRTYDGYHFHQKGEGVYNPYSILCAFADREYDSYWFETGTPTFLVKRLKDIHFDVQKFTDGNLYATKQMLKDYRDDNPDPVPLLYQSGYLTLQDYDPEDRSYTLTFPNEEVKYGFLECLMPMYVEGVGAGTGKDILTLKRHCELGELDNIRDVFRALFASIPYTAEKDPFEHDFQTVIFITMTLLGQYARCELHTSVGRIDCVLETRQYIYIFEFKRDDSTENALKQIEEKHYADIYAADARKLYKIGVSFSSATRQMEGWEVR